MKKTLKKIIAGVFALVLLNASLSAGAPEKEFCVSSYIRTWGLGSTIEEISKGRHWSAKDVNGKYLTDIIVAFAHVDQKTWGIFFPDAESEDKPFTELWTEVAKLQKKYPDLKIHVSVGGWGADGFSEMAADDTKRATFVSALVKLLEEKKIDGIDIDWEYPVGPEWGQEIASSPEDGKNFITLLSNMRAAFTELGKKTGKTYSISCAVPNSSWYVQKIDVVKVASIVDSIKMMSYDYYGAWSAQTGHHANLMNNPADPDWGGWSTDQGVHMYLDAGVPAEKIVLGVAFYGRAWKGVPDNGVHGLYQKYAESAYPDGLSWTDLKKSFLSKKSGYTRYWDDVAKAPFLYNGDIFVTYTDKEEIQLIGEYVKKMGLAGVMTWEYGHDLDCDLGKALYQSVKK